jgi:3-oxoacyl-[acyl-carrier protein] reductase
VYAAECDVTDRERVFEFVGEVTDEFGDVDVLVNNAGGSFQSPFEELSENA